jgi:6-phosphogluconolactonase (cycloisomerase 2 family)
VYVITNQAGKNAVEAFTRDPGTGRITHKGRYETGGEGDPFTGGVESHALVGDRRRLFAVDPGSDTISSFAVQEDGALRLLGAVPSGGRRPLSLALHGDLLYVANQGNIPGSAPSDQLPASYTGFRVRPNGRLEPIAGSTIALERGDSPGEILFNHDGTRLIACRLGGGIIDTFHVSREGLLERASALPGLPGPFGSMFSPTRPAQLFVTLAAGEAGPPAPGVVSYELTDGALSTISVVTDAALKDPCWVAVTPDGKQLWASSFIPRSLTRYAIDDEGRLTQQSSYMPSEGPGSTDIALDAAGRFLYQLRAFDVVKLRDGSITPEIAVLEVTGDAADGGLRLVQSLSIATDLDRAGVTGMLIIDLD